MTRGATTAAGRDRDMPHGEHFPGRSNSEIPTERSTALRSRHTSRRFRATSRSCGFGPAAGLSVETT